MSIKTRLEKKQQSAAEVPKKTGVRKSIKEIHSDLGFAPVEEAYKSGLDELDIDPELKQELKEKDLVHRFINFRTYKQYGFHKGHWKPYKRESTPKNSVMFNLDPNGFMTKGDLVLAVKPTEWNDARKKELQAINKKKERIIEQKTKEFQQHAKEVGVETQVVKDGPQ